MPSGKVSEDFNSTTATAAPPTIVRTDAMRLGHRGLLPPASAESAASR
jgi:hypothetical protein